MSKRSKNHRKSRTQKNLSIDKSLKRKQEWVRLLDESRSNEDKILKTEITISPEFVKIINKFELDKTIDKEEKSITSQENITEDDLLLTEETNLSTCSLHHNDKITSKRKQKKLEKPSLADLKSSAIYPELIQWFDCDSKDPLFLARIKSEKNIVPVPSHWRLKREYLSGRSLMLKKPFELPDVIKETDIEIMRNTIPNSDSPDEKSLKENSRSRVQPKLGKLDIDYKKLHDAFFKIGKKWRPNLFLPFGDIYYENRNLDQEIEWNLMKSQFKPGKISENLRIALNFTEGKLPSWCKKMKEHGLPPSYPGMKIAGINWDITNLTNETYGSINPITKKTKVELFGSLLSFKHDELITTEGKKNLKDINEGEQELEQHQQDLKVPEAIESVSIPQEHTTQENIEKPKQLYTVLKEKEELQSSKTVYNLINESRSLESHLRTKHKQEEPDTAYNFKF